MHVAITVLTVLLIVLSFAVAAASIHPKPPVAPHQVDAWVRTFTINARTCATIGFVLLVLLVIGWATGTA